MKITISDERGNSREEALSDFQEFIGRKEYIHFTGLFNRDGVQPFVEFIEHEYYKPFTNRNPLFHFRVIEWEDMTFVFMSIPVMERHYIDNNASKFGLRIADGVPTLISGTSTKIFPANNERVYTFENVSGHPTYENNPLTPRRN